MNPRRDQALFIALLLLSAVLVISTWAMVWRLIPEHRRRAELPWLVSWSIKGLALPIIFWAVINFGLGWDLQPFMPEVQWARNNGGKWVPTFLAAVGTGMFIVSSYWMVLTLGWAVSRATRGLDSEPRSDFKGLCFTCALGLFLPALGIFYLGGLPTMGFALGIIVAPIAGYLPGILKVKKLPPMYARAVARMKFGKYNEAEWEIIKQLEKSEDDFEGWMMLAELYAKHFHDLSEAEHTVLELCGQPKTTPPQLSIALHRLSDWQLAAERPEAARGALQMICNRLPGTHLAHMAELRMRQLPETVEQLREQRSHRPIPVPEGENYMQTLREQQQRQMDRSQAAELAQACVDQLTRDPDDVEAREKLARVFTERLQKAGEGIEQLRLLLNMPEQSEAKRAEWLNLMANWEINYREDQETGRKLLERVIREFPERPEAAAARRRLQGLEPQYRG